MKIKRAARGQPFFFVVAGEGGLALRVSPKPPDSNGIRGFFSFAQPVADGDVMESAQSAHDGLRSRQLTGIPVQRSAESREDDIGGGQA